jgi:hypothetical protein
MKLMVIAVFASLAYAVEVDEACNGKCCTLKITRPAGDEEIKYSGKYILKNGVYEMKGNADIRIEEVETSFYDDGEEDYVEFENWGIMDDTRPSYQQDWPAVEGGLAGEDPVGVWPNGGEAECLKKNKQGKCRKLKYTHARGENGIYEQVVDTYGAQFGFREWKQKDNAYWFFSFNEDPELHNVHEGGFTKSEDQDYWDDYSDDQSGGTLEGEWTDGTIIECIGNE